jgi:hypothetical protein
MVTLQNLITRAHEVRDERQRGANTATRVGSLFYDIVLFFNDLISEKQDKGDEALKTKDKTVTGAINELGQSVSKKQDKTDETLETEDKTVVGAINELWKIFDAFEIPELISSDGSINVTGNCDLSVNERRNYLRRYSEDGAYPYPWFNATPDSIEIKMPTEYGYWYDRLIADDTDFTVRGRYNNENYSYRILDISGDRGGVTIEGIHENQPYTSLKWEGQNYGGEFRLSLPYYHSFYGSYSYPAFTVSPYGMWIGRRNYSGDGHHYALDYNSNGQYLRFRTQDYSGNEYEWGNFEVWGIKLRGGYSYGDWLAIQPHNFVMTDSSTNYQQPFIQINPNNLRLYGNAYHAGGYDVMYSILDSNPGHFAAYTWSWGSNDHSYEFIEAHPADFKAANYEFYNGSYWEKFSPIKASVASLECEMYDPSGANTTFSSFKYQYAGTYTELSLSIDYAGGWDGNTYINKFFSISPNNGLELRDRINRGVLWSNSGGGIGGMVWMADNDWSDDCFGFDLQRWSNDGMGRFMVWANYTTPFQVETHTLYTEFPDDYEGLGNKTGFDITYERCGFWSTRWQHIGWMFHVDDKNCETTIGTDKFVFPVETVQPTINEFDQLENKCRMWLNSAKTQLNFSVMVGGILKTATLSLT